ncbi:HAMP domain-containing histidine kinase [Actinoplanes bogorensis]|uniref:histidine kinase n=1 Tax=Paractinoplanes bogorensis TaxID=1610840 RepID=A0ABS5YX06_9ACTN|nr:HAMP domain-containing sensor histidine kinase [Actinoplanes bogorensis]MBU2667972.1 HAMP domain-containing histidine kinase [Actinoplanes bogorensis]
MSMRRRVRNAIVLVAVLALMLFGVPLAVVLDRLATSQALTTLQRDATRGVAAVPDNVLEAGSRVRVPAGSRGIRIAVYDARGGLVAGAGPDQSALAARVTDGREHDGRDGGDLSVVVPVLSDTTIAGSVRAAVPLARLRAATYRMWALLAGLAGLVLGIAVLLARRSARRIAEPFERLTVAARGLGDDRYDVELPRSGIAEADAAGDALRDSAREVDLLLRQERDFVRHASHQLRTPLSGVLLALDRPAPDVPAALARARDLETTIADLLSLRSRTAGSCDPGDIAAEAVRRWTTPQRPIELRRDDTGDVAIAEPALRQSLDVLLDNAVRHGAGAVTVTVEPYGETVLIEVADRGAGFTASATPGTGLRLAEGIVERAGGSIVIRQRAPYPRVALLVPAAQPGSQSGPHSGLQPGSQSGSQSGSNR